MGASSNVAHLMGDARGVGLVFCLLGVLIGAAALVVRAKSGHSTGSVWSHVLAGIAGAVAVGGMFTMLTFAYGH